MWRAGYAVKARGNQRGTGRIPSPNPALETNDEHRMVKTVGYADSIRLENVMG
jgi:hypothetical protein